MALRHKLRASNAVARVAAAEVVEELKKKTSSTPLGAEASEPGTRVEETSSASPSSHATPTALDAKEEKREEGKRGEEKEKEKEKKRTTVAPPAPTPVRASPRRAAHENEKAEEDAKTSARDLERVSLDADAARREARASKARDELGARESSGLASSLRDAKAEVAEMRRRCEYLEKIAAFAAAAGSETTPGGVYVEGRPVPGRDVPANRPLSSALRGGAPPAPDPKAHRRDGKSPRDLTLFRLTSNERNASEMHTRLPTHYSLR